jgi:hypothetical protein
MSFEDFQGKYDVMVGANSRALHLARGAESRRILRNNPGVREAENNQQCNRWSVPEYSEHEQSVNTERQIAACKDEEVREAETNNNTIGGRFLNIVNMNNLSTRKDELLHAKMKK